jgi:hypothetical protein
MELKLGDLVKHKNHGFYGIVISSTGYWGSATVCRVEWCESGKSHLIDVSFLDKVVVT